MIDSLTTNPEHKKRHLPPPKEELAKMQFLKDMTYSHDGWVGRIKRWFYSVYVNSTGGKTITCLNTGEFAWDEEDAALAKVDEHHSIGNVAYVVRSPAYTDSDIAADARRTRIDSGEDQYIYKSDAREAWYELPDDIYNVDPYEHAHRFEKRQHSA